MEFGAATWRGRQQVKHRVSSDMHLSLSLSLGIYIYIYIYIYICVCVCVCVCVYILHNITELISTLQKAH